MTAAAEKLDLKRWAPDGTPLVQVRREGYGQRVIRLDQVAAYERRGYEVQKQLADAPFVFPEPEAEEAPKPKAKKKTKPKG